MGSNMTVRHYDETEADDLPILSMAHLIPKPEPERVIIQPDHRDCVLLVTQAFSLYLSLIFSPEWSGQERLAWRRRTRRSLVVVVLEVERVGEIDACIDIHVTVPDRRGRTGRCLIIVVFQVESITEGYTSVTIAVSATERGNWSAHQSGVSSGHSTRGINC